VAEAVLELSMIGLDRVAGVFGTDAVAAWAASGRTPETVQRIPAIDGAARMKAGATLLDVRGRSEWEAGHVPGAVHIPLGYLAERVGELPAGTPVVVHCQGGTRSAIAASVLQRAGVAEVYDLTEGFTGWRKAGLPVRNGRHA
jgi:hydroxyacylglutathione hydrolase